MIEFRLASHRIASAIKQSRREVFRFFALSSNAVLPPERESRDSIVRRRGQIPDKVRVYVRGGAGGQGCPTTGGVGGRGGSVMVTCLKGGSLSTYAMAGNKRIIAGQGTNSTREPTNAHKGKDVTVSVPLGTIVWSSTGQVLADLNKEGETMKAAAGGAGGSQTNGYSGQKGERKTIVLELKSIADIALVGFPNAGKSTLLRAISKSRPKVGSYPFTTLNPVVGSVWYSDKEQVTVADLPGLIEEAHLNRGMGHKFLRHVERTKALALVVDINGFQLKESRPHRSCCETIALLLNELARYEESLLDRPYLLVVNKMDTADSKSKLDQLLEQLQTHAKSLGGDDVGSGVRRVFQALIDSNCERVVPISASTGEGILVFKEKLRGAVKEGQSVDNSAILYRQ